MRNEKAKVDRATRSIIEAARQVHDLTVAAITAETDPAVARVETHAVDGEGKVLGYRYAAPLAPIVDRVLRVEPRRYAHTSDDVRHYTAPVYEYLRLTANALCLDRGNGNLPPVWWVRADWHPVEGLYLSSANRTADQPLPTLAEVRAAGMPREPLSRTERRVTPREAGENREPAPVEVTKVATPEGKSPGRHTPESWARFEAGRTRMLAARSEKVRRDVLDALAAATAPVSATTLATRIGRDRSATARALRSFSDEGLAEIHSRKGSTIRYVPAGWTAPEPAPPAPKTKGRPSGSFARVSDAERARRRDVALRALADAGRPMGVGHVAVALGLHSYLTRQILAGLAEEGLVIRTRVGPASKMSVWSLPESPSVPAVPTTPPVAALPPVPAPAAPGGDVAARIRALRERAEHADELERRAEKAEAEVAALRAELAEVRGLLGL